MAEYIEREAVFKIVTDMICDCKVTHKGRAIRRNIKQLPVADVVEVRHGEWIDSETNEGAVCSLCKSFFDSYYGFFADEQFKYCPNCGAKMDGKGD